MGAYRVKLDEEKSKHAALDREIGLEQAYLHSLLRFDKGNQRCAPARKECNKCDLTTSPVFRLAKANDCSTWFAISSLPSICSHNFSFIWGLPQKQLAKLGRVKYFAGSHTEHLWAYSKCRTLHCKAY
jgi:hypothetical protein